jgi:chorismate mutase/prephenate dehydratase
MSGKDLAKLRGEIDALDRQVLELFERRLGLARAVGKLKGKGPAYRPEREREILGRLPAHARPVFREIISACRGAEESIRVAYLGPPGTFSEQAVSRHFGAAVEARPAASIDEVFRDAESGATQFAVVPVENSTDGVVGRSLDLLLLTPLKICGEIELRVKQNLLSKTTKAKIKTVFSHAQSLAQCNAWLAKHLPGAARVPVASNAEAAQRAARDKSAAAIAGEVAAERYKLKVLARDIEDDPSNTTRFLVLGGLDPEPTGKDRTSLVMSAENKPGAVHALLSPLAAHGVSMTRIESRPSRVRTSLWEYVFFIDVEGHRADAPVQKAIEALKSKAPFLKVLGSYPTAVN